MFRNQSNVKKYFLQWLLVRQSEVNGRFIVLLDISHADMEAAKNAKIKGDLRSKRQVKLGESMACTLKVKSINLPLGSYVRGCMPFGDGRITLFDLVR